MGNKGRPNKARPLANYNNASPPLSDAAPAGQATGRGTKTAPVLPAATLPSIPTLEEASGKFPAPATDFLPPRWRDGTPAFIPPPGANVGSAASFAPPAAAQAAAAERASRGRGGDGSEYNPSAKLPPRPPAENEDDDEVNAEEEEEAGERGGKGRSGAYNHWRPMDDLLLVRFGTSLRVLAPPTSSHMRCAWVSMSFPSTHPGSHTANSMGMASKKGEKNIDADWQLVTDHLNGSRDVSFQRLTIKQVKYRFAKLVKAALSGNEGSLRKSGSQEPEPELQAELATAVQHHNEGTYHLVKKPSFFFTHMPYLPLLSPSLRSLPPLPPSHSPGEEGDQKQA